jgi:oxaloacetate decarboxylase gamma subunit
MTIVEMLNQSAVLTLLGMGIVFSFLTILVVIISQMGRLFSSKKE